MELSARTIALARILWDYNYVKQDVEASDLIFGLGSKDVRVAERAAELYNSELAPKVLFSGYQGEAETFAAKAEQLGVPGHAILLESKASNTGENITLGYETLQAAGLNPQSIILVQQPHMLRRTYATFKKQWPGNEVKITVTAPQLSFEEYMLSEAPVDQKRLINVFVGYTQRMKVYAEKGFQIPQEIPSEVWSAYEQLVSLGFTEHLAAE